MRVTKNTKTNSANGMNAYKRMELNLLKNYSRKSKLQLKKIVKDKRRELNKILKEIMLKKDKSD